MNKSLWQILAILLLFSACAPSVTNIPIATTQLETETPSPIPTSTPTFLPSATSTATITPLPTIPTFTPTFDTSTIVTVTPAPKAECFKEDPNLVPTFYVPKHPGCFDTDQCVFGGTEKEILEFLNSGGTVQSVIARLKTAIYGDYHEYAYQDVTNDTIPDLIFIDFSVYGTLHILFCADGVYQLFSSPHNGNESFYGDQNIIVEDLNLDDVPEVLFLQGSANSCCSIHTFEWDSQTFQDLSPGAETNTGITIGDDDQNGMKEIIATGIASLSGFYSVPYFGPPDFNIPEIRVFTRVYSWNGINFVFASERFEPPQYLFQAIQDGDFEVIDGQYNRGLSLYEDAIFSSKLNWWSPTQYEFMKNKYYNTDVTLPPTPTEDPSEFPRLAAYAYYRIMLIHLLQNNESEANTTYNTLQQTFGNDPYGHPYVEMATAFWNAYQSTHKMYDGCAGAIQYAALHPEILIPLGSDYHGSQSHTYVPADICPFR